MKRKPVLLCFALGLFACNDNTKDASAAEDQVEKAEIAEVRLDIVPAVTGIQEL